MKDSYRGDLAADQNENMEDFGSGKPRKKQNCFFFANHGESFNLDNGQF